MTACCGTAAAACLNLCRSMFIDQVQGGSIQLAAGLRILYERVDWTSETIVVPVDREAKWPS